MKKLIHDFMVTIFFFFIAGSNVYNFYFLFSYSGAVASGCLGDCSKRMSIQHETQKNNAFRMFNERKKFAAFGDLFASVNFTAQYGNFQRLFLDLTRASARFDISSGSLFICGASRLAQDFFFSRRPDIETFCDVCPDVVVSFQQQVNHVFVSFSLFSDNRN
jgi:hypothetical protein